MYNKHNNIIMIRRMVVGVAANRVAIPPRIRSLTAAAAAAAAAVRNNNYANSNTNNTNVVVASAAASSASATTATTTTTTTSSPKFNNDDHFVRSAIHKMMMQHQHKQQQQQQHDEDVVVAKKSALGVPTFVRSDSDNNNNEQDSRQELVQAQARIVLENQLEEARLCVADAAAETLSEASREEEMDNAHEALDRAVSAYVDYLEAVATIVVDDQGLRRNAAATIKTLRRTLSNLGL